MRSSFASISRSRRTASPTAVSASSVTTPVAPTSASQARSCIYRALTKTLNSGLRFFAASIITVRASTAGTVTSRYFACLIPAAVRISGRVASPYTLRVPDSASDFTVSKFKSITTGLTPKSLRMSIATKNQPVPQGGWRAVYELLVGRNVGFSCLIPVSKRGASSLAASSHVMPL